MDDMLYTLFVIAWIAYGIYKGVKKNNAPKKKSMALESEPNIPQEESKVGNTFESIFKEVFDLPTEENDKMEHPYQAPEAQKTPKTQPVYENYLGKDVLDSYKGTDHVESVFKDTNINSIDDDDMSKNTDNQDEEVAYTAQNTVFDLRQAVIHQVILERPY